MRRWIHRCHSHDRSTDPLIEARVRVTTMKTTAILIAIPALALASLNCTIIAPSVTQRYCEWERCQPHATATAGQIVHAGCRADCSTEEE